MHHLSSAVVYLLHEWEPTWTSKENNIDKTCTVNGALNTFSSPCQHFHTAHAVSNIMLEPWSLQVTISVVHLGVVHSGKRMLPVNQVEVLIDAELLIRIPRWHVASDFLNLPKSRNLRPKPRNTKSHMLTARRKINTQQNAKTENHLRSCKVIDSALVLFVPLFAGSQSAIIPGFAPTSGCYWWDRKQEFHPDLVSRLPHFFPKGHIQYKQGHSKKYTAFLQYLKNKYNIQFIT